MDSTGGLNDDLDSVARPDAGASHAQPSRQLSWRAEPRPTEIHTMTVPGAAIRDHPPTVGRRDTRQCGVELDAQSRTCQLPDADNTQCVVVHPISPSTLFNIPASKESQNSDAQGLTRFWPMLLSISMQLTPQLRSQMRGRNDFSLPQVDLPRERTVIRHRTEQVDRTVSTQTSFRPSAPSPPPPKQQSASTSPLQSLPAPAIAKTASRPMHTPRNILPYELQAPSNGTLFESPHPDEDRGNVCPKEEGHKDPSAVPHGLIARPKYTPATTKLPSRQDYNYPPAAPHRLLPLAPTERTPVLTGPPSRLCRNSSSVSHGLPAPPEDTNTATDLPSLQDYRDPSAASHKPFVIPEHTPAAAESPSLFQLVSGPRRLDRRNSPLQEEKRINGIKQVVEGPRSDSRVQKHVGAEECDNRPKDREIAEPNPATSYALDVSQYSKTTPENFIQRTQSSPNSCEYDPSPTHLPDLGDSREKMGHSTNSTPPLDEREAVTTPPPALVYTQNQPEHVTRVSSIKNRNLTAFTTNPLLRPPSLSGDSKTLITSPAQPATEILNAPSNLMWGRESQAQPDFFPRIAFRDPIRWRQRGPGAAPRYGQPLGNGQPPPRIRGLLPPKGKNLNASLPGPSRYAPPVEHRQPPDRIRDQFSEEEEEVNASFCSRCCRCCGDF